MSFLQLLFIVSNIAIFFGYIFVAVAIAPNFGIKSARTRWAGIVFFTTCGLTHAELAVHAVLDESITLEEMTSWHMLLIHAVQAASVWFFVTGLYNEFVRGDRTPIVEKPTDS